ncbi:MAG: polysaccharide lyase [Bacteroidia bacterium]|jgi:hypothetical protein|nr:polysaccharide lyase [Bacteroidia bacterium]
MKKTAFALFVILSAGCYKARNEYLETAVTDYSDGFENYTRFPQPEFLDNWPGSQLTLSGNTISIDSTFSHTGSRSLRCEAANTAGGEVSKASILKNDLGFEQGDEIYFECWYYLNAASLPNIFIADFEEPALISSGPGFRLMLNDNGALCVERNKMNERTLSQTIAQPRVFPQMQWVRIQLEAKLHKRNKGYVKLWQNGELILEHYDVQTLPRDMIYVTQGTAAVLRQVEIGLTANSSSGAAVLYVDDFVVRKLR